LRPVKAAPLPVNEPLKLLLVLLKVTGLA
jgi:hypothetical protein